MKDGIVILIKRNNKFLMVERAIEPFKGFWGPVHGVIKTNETEEEAVIRETLEEVGLKVKPIKKITTTPADYKVENLYWWEAEYQEGKIKIDTSEISNYGFFSLEEILKLKLFSQTRKFFEDKKQLSS